MNRLIRYHVLGGRLVLPMVGAATVAGLTVFALGGVAGPRASHPPAASDVARYEHEVFVQSLRQGCRWQPFDDPTVQVADCGDERDPVRLVFQGGKVTEYRIVVRLDPQRPSPTPAAAPGARTASSVAAAASAAARSGTPGPAPSGPTPTPQA